MELVLYKCYLLLLLWKVLFTFDLKSLLVNYINLDFFFRLNKFVELLNNIYILAQNAFLAAFDEITQFLVSVRN